MAHDIFISYSSHDKTIADAIVAALEQNGLRCWSAPRDIKPGADWGESITEAITGCKLILLIFSSSSNQSKRVLDEIYYAISEEKIILPFRVENLAPTSAMRLHLSSRHWLDAFQPSWKAHIDQLVNSAWDMVGRPAPPQPAPAVPVQQTPAVFHRPVEKPSKKLPLMWIGLGLAAALLVGAGAMALINGRGNSLLAAGDKTPDAAIATAAQENINNPTAPPTLSAGPMNTATANSGSSSGIKIITVTSAEDSGPGSLRQALFEVNEGDTIQFDPQVFPPSNPVRIFIKSQLPVIWLNELTINACNAGVILDGSSVTEGWMPGLKIKSDHNTVIGLQVVNFSGPGIVLEEPAEFNKIGDDRETGSGPIGCGNLFSANSDGIYIEGSHNIITGNLVGTTADGSGQMGNRASGVVLSGSASYNRIGPDNIIAFNGETEAGDYGIVINTETVCNNTITGNSIYENSPAGSDIGYNIQGASSCPHLEPPVFLYADLDTGTAAGTVCSGCTVEIFSSESGDGRVFEGSVIAGKYGQFLFTGGKPFAGPFLTATSSGTNVNTSQFSFPTDAPLPLVLAVAKMAQEAPVFETSFDDPAEFSITEEEKAVYRFENSKFVVFSAGEHRSLQPVVGQALKSFAVEFVMTMRDYSPDGHCFISFDNMHTDDTNRRTVSPLLHAANSFSLGYYDNNQKDTELASARVEAINGEKTIRFILVGDQAAAFLDGKLVYAARIPGGGDVYQEPRFGANLGATCEFDDFKLWDLTSLTAAP